MKIYLSVIILIFCLQSWTKADDISEFQIAGISIGDSLLDFYSEKEIEKFYNYDDLPSDMKFRIADYENKTGQYDGLQFFYKPEDKKFIIHSVSGHVYCYSNNECNKILEQIKSDMSKSLGNLEFKKNTYKHFDDKSGKSIGTVYFLNTNNGTLDVDYINWSKKMNYTDNVSVSLNTNEVIDWLESNYGTN